MCGHGVRTQETPYDDAVHNPADTVNQFGTDEHEEGVQKLLPGQDGDIRNLLHNL